MSEVGPKFGKALKSAAERFMVSTGVKDRPVWLALVPRDGLLAEYIPRVRADPDNHSEGFLSWRPQGDAIMPKELVMLGSSLPLRVAVFACPEDGEPLWYGENVTVSAGDRVSFGNIAFSISW